MHTQKNSTAFCAALAVALVFASAAVAQEKIIHNFNANGKDGYGPAVSLVFDANGNLFGTTENGGANSFGILYELSPAKVGGWFERVLFAFKRGPGIYPDSGLIVDGSGNLYGTTLEAGANTDGTVFELKPLATGRWQIKVLSDLAGIGDRPEAPLLFDAAGNLYGTTHAGGRSAQGTVFELSPAPGGTWTSTVLHTFSGHGTDGTSPVNTLVFDSSGNLYGTTNSGGAHDYGTVYELTPAGDGTWSEKLLHSFQLNTGDGLYPSGGLVSDNSGNLYGVTRSGGAYGNGLTSPGGTVFELSPAADGSWTETLLHSFGNGSDGSYPSGLNFGADGSLYGETSSGGVYGGGTVFRLTPAVGGTWPETILHNFGHGTDGTSPRGGLVLDAAGNLYGVTGAGGKYQYGTAFEITP